MDLPAVIDLFNQTVRAEPIPRPWTPVTRTDRFVRLGGHLDFLLWWSLTAAAAAEAVADQVAHVRASGRGLLWRVYAFDEPPELPGLLRAAGFVEEESGTLMFRDLALPFPLVADDAATISRVRTLAALDDYVAAGDLAFDEDGGWQREAFAERLADPDLALFVAHVDGRPAAAGRLDMSVGDVFGYLFGGGVVPAHRRKGVYRALVAARVAVARARGLKYLCTDARDASRPILQSLGFVPVARQMTWLLTP